MTDFATTTVNVKWLRNLTEFNIRHLVIRSLHCGTELSTWHFNSYLAAVLNGVSTCFHYIRLNYLQTSGRMSWFSLSCILCRAVLATRFPSVCLSVKCINYDKTKETSAEIITPYKRHTHLVFWQEMVGGGRPLVPEILGQTDPVPSKTPIFSQYSLVAPQP